QLMVGTEDKDNRSYRVSFEKIASILPAFKCRRDAGTGAIQFRELFQRIQMSPEQFQFRAFTRLKQIQHLMQTGQITDRLFWS
ncbi:MAG TPA: NAD-dependent dehydratase, partial [Terriglobia bacterium]|nr:NAD-dependent dehydratase [Terriglobia bacterium]